MLALRRQVGAADLKQGYQVHLWAGILEAVFVALGVEVYQRAPPSSVVSWEGVQVDSGPGLLEEVVVGLHFAFRGRKVKALPTNKARLVTQLEQYFSIAVIIFS